MANPPRQKGTGYETEVVNDGLERGLDIVRQPASSTFDLMVRGSTGRFIDALATRPDRGQSLVTIRLDDFFHLLSEHGDNARIECKRYARFALHTIFDKKFGRG